MGDNALIEGDKVVMGGSPVPPLGKTMNYGYQNSVYLKYSFFMSIVYFYYTDLMYLKYTRNIPEIYFLYNL